MTDKTLKFRSILSDMLLLDMEDFNNEDILEQIASLKDQILPLELLLVDEELLKLESTPEGLTKTVEKWCSYPLNFISLEGRHLENGEYEAKIQPNTWDENYRPNENRVYTSTGKYYLVAYPDSPSQYINNVATFLYNAYSGDKKVMNGDIDVISRETYHKLIGD